eukprot:1194640-Prorocentrum_minimum.AAC.8
MAKRPANLALDRLRNESGDEPSESRDRGECANSRRTADWAPTWRGADCAGGVRPPRAGTASC